MSRRVPEFALVTGGFLALTLLVVGVAFTGDVVRSTLTAAVVGYPFALYAVHHSDDPTAVLPPRLVLSATAVVAVGVLLTAFVGPLEGLPRRLLSALFAALAVGLPPAVYAVRYGGLEPLPPRPTLVGSALGGATLLVVGPAVGDAVVAAADALLVYLAGNGYADSHGVGTSHRLRRLLVVAGGLLSLLLVAGGVLLGPTLLPWVLAGVTAALAPSLHYALSVGRVR